MRQIEALDEEIRAIEGRMKEVLSTTREVELLQTLPRVGFILATVIALEVGDVGRFPGPEKLASYAGMVPWVHSSGGKTRYGRTRKDVNRYLKWAYSEARNVVDPPLSETALPGAFRGHPRPLCRGCKHPQDLRLSGWYLPLYPPREDGQGTRVYAGSGDLQKSRWEATMQIGHNKCYTMHYAHASGFFVLFTRMRQVPTTGPRSSLTI